MRRPLLVLLLGLFACKGDDGPGTSPTPTPMPSPTGATGGATGDTGGTPSTEVLQADLAQSEVVPTVFEARFDSEVGGQGYVEVAGEDGVWWPTERTALGSTTHTVRVLGLKADHDYQWRAVVDTDDGERLVSAEASLRTEPVPAGFPPLTLEQADLTRTVDERFYVLFNIVGYDTSYAIVVDHEGDPVWWVPSPTSNFNVTIVQPSLDGQSVLHGLLNVDTPTTGVTRTPLGAMTEADRTFTRMPNGHHAFVEHADGSFVFLAHEYTSIAPWDEHPEALVQTSLLVSLPEGSDGSDAEPLFRVITDTDLVGNGHTCSHNEAQQFQGQLQVEYGHANSLVYLPSRDSYAINFRNLDRVVEVSRSTGELTWQLGGTESDFSIDALPNRFEHGHFTHMWADGLAMFSNDLHSGGSRLLVYDVDVVGRSLTTSWAYEQPQGETVAVLGDIDLIAPRSAMVSWATLSTVQQLSAPDEVTWSLRVDDATVGRLSYLTDLYTLASPAAPGG